MWSVSPKEVHQDHKFPTASTSFHTISSIKINKLAFKIHKIQLNDQTIQLLHWPIATFWRLQPLRPTWLSSLCCDVIVSDSAVTRRAFPGAFVNPLAPHVDVQAQQLPLSDAEGALALGFAGWGWRPRGGLRDQLFIGFVYGLFGVSFGFEGFYLDFIFFLLLVPTSALSEFGLGG